MTEDKLKKIAESDNLDRILGSKGSIFPIIQINDYIFSSNEILDFSVHIGDFIPYCNLTLSIKSGIFQAQHLPKDGDLISVYFRSGTNLLKVFRADFLILNYFTEISNREITETKYFIKGILNINNFFSERNKIFKELTSLEVVLEIANEIGLGVVSNETKTNDKMNWICGWESYYTFLRRLKNHIYKDDKSFYDIFIDNNYNINFLNLNLLYENLDKENKALIGLIKDSTRDDYSVYRNIFKAEELVLTNHINAKKSNIFFEGLSYLNNSGEININNGYKVNFYYFDYSKNKVKDFILESRITPGSEKKMDVLKGRYGENFYKKDFKKYWCGISYSNTNYHQYYDIAEFQNKVNLNQIEKMMIKLYMPFLNLNLYVGMRIPIIVISNDKIKSQVVGNKDDYNKYNDSDLIVDRSLSGYYLIKKIVYFYNKKSFFERNANDELEEVIIEGMSQYVYLSKREWPEPGVGSYIDYY